MLSERACAKINLHLHVVGRRPDGYHLLDSLVVFAGAADVLTVERAGTLSLAVTGPFAAGLDNEADNLVLRAARALAIHADVPPAGRLVLEKNLPVASGIGGGSADAAAALRLLDRFWEIGAGQGVLAAIAGGLGADVPVCVSSRPALMSGIGEILAPAPRLPEAGIVLVNPGVAVSTPAVFRARDGGFSTAAVWPAGGWRDAKSLAASLHATGNDLEAAALGLAPGIGEALAALAADARCLLARMSGSGATCFGLYADAAVARAAAAAVARPGWWVWGGGINSG
nr:4-(cytidine 5'-diphospho)-2-C-methyl-D-erythritol kinase [uncultured Rhodopila sp.]